LHKQGEGRKQIQFTKMKIFKFGGASVKDAVSVRNVVEILRNHPEKQLVVVLSAMGKMTNAFEELAIYAYEGKQEQATEQFNRIHSFHQNILTELFPDSNNLGIVYIKMLFKEIESIVQWKDKRQFDYYYDQIVPYGELLSTGILSGFLEESGLRHTLLDARKVISTNAAWRDAAVLWPETISQIRNAIKTADKVESAKPSFILTQGFIGSDLNGNTTTLGREGSDFTAAIFAHALNASEVVIWKDVPGLLNADPRIFPETVKIDRLSYADAIELAYYGAKIIHPKTIKPLQNKQIPLLIKSFADPASSGSLITDIAEKSEPIPSYIFKFNQILISITPKDFSIINEENLFDIFGIFSQFRIRINMMQNSAISFSVCIDGDRLGFDELLKRLQQKFAVKYNRNLELITIRNYTQQCIDRVVKNRQVLLEQRSRATAQFLVVPD